MYPSINIKVALVASAAVLAVGLMVGGLSVGNQQPSDATCVAPHPAAAPAANEYVQTYVREYGRLPPVHHGQTVIIPGNPFKSS
jgi:hypothetical protein